MRCPDCISGPHSPRPLVTARLTSTAARSNPDARQHSESLTRKNIHSGYPASTGIGLTLQNLPWMTSQLPQVYNNMSERQHAPDHVMRGLTCQAPTVSTKKRIDNTATIRKRHSAVDLGSPYLSLVVCRALSFKGCTTAGVKMRQSTRFILCSKNDGKTDQYVREVFNACKFCTISTFSGRYPPRGTLHDCTTFGPAGRKVPCNLQGHPRQQRMACTISAFLQARH